MTEPVLVILAAASALTEASGVLRPPPAVLVLPAPLQSPVENNPVEST